MDYPELTLRIGGKRVAGGGRQVIPVASPSTLSELGALPVATAADLGEALAAAAEAFREWRQSGPRERHSLLRNTAAILRDRAGTIAELIAAELGKPLAQGLIEADTAAGMFDWAAEECRRSYGRVIPAQPGLHRYTVYEPVGPVVGFSGWNAPAITPSRKISGAIAAGCSIVMKPAESTPATALFIADTLESAGLPPGVLNVIFGDPAFIAETLLHSPVTRMVTFTGSTVVGRQLSAMAGQDLMRAVMELGGHAPVVVLPDADADATVSGAVPARLRNSGQVCTSPTRFLVHADLYERFTDSFCQLASEWRVGDPFDGQTQMGPIHTERRLAALKELVHDAVARGATVRLGGARLDRPGYFFAPTVLTDVPVAARINNEEPFGPIAVLSRFESDDEALAEANRIPVGLAAYVFGRDSRSIRRMVDGISAGNVIVNDWSASGPETPFGGWNDSGYGSEGGAEGLREFQRLKFVSQRP
jgi:succinate-semialdehyde dehydrogenase / glutarate-semialdehyde dehydrogenase